MFCACVISDCPDHNTSFYAFKSKLVHLCTKFFSPKRVEYFSDGSAVQHNRKNVNYIIYHYKDFGLSAKLHFFARSHGKGPADGIEGSVKWLDAKIKVYRNCTVIKLKHLINFNNCNSNTYVTFFCEQILNYKKEHSY